MAWRRPMDVSMPGFVQGTVADAMPAAPAVGGLPARAGPGGRRSANRTGRRRFPTPHRGLRPDGAVAARSAR